jgi:pyruvate dehydrogenase E2 component (dihydrolipoamide acetyltransferase)
MSVKQPKDKSHFILPDLGEGVHEAELIKWRVKPGDRVDEHQTLAEMETDKALVEVPSPWSGIIKELHGNEGEILHVGNTLVTYAIENSAAPAASAPVSVAADTEDAGTVVGSVDATLTVPDRFARIPGEVAAENVRSRTLATPAVRRIARDLGVELSSIAGSGRGGRVTASDVQGSAQDTGVMSTPEQAPTPVPASAPQITVSTDGVAQRIPFRGIRRKIAQALDLSVKTAVHFTVVEEADVTALDRKRTEYSQVIGRKISYLPLVMMAACKALRIHPALNANVDDAREEILLKSVINLGCAVDTDHGLMVPVLTNADALSLVQLSDGVAELAEGCRNRTIARENLVGGTFTISNVGSYGGMFATPIINYPEVAILAAGRVTEQVMTRDGAFYAGKVMPLSLSCDHRVVDGAEGARFLGTMVKLLEEPDRLVG